MDKLRRALTIGLLAGSLALTGAGMASAAPNPNAGFQNVDTACVNNGGNQPGGQQPTCKGGGLTQESEVRNRGGNAPPGQQN
jgi:hypothetical protein